MNVSEKNKNFKNIFNRKTSAILIKNKQPGCRFSGELLG